MTTLKAWNGTTWEILPGIIGDPGAPGQPRVGGLLAVQRQWGRMERWQPGHAFQIPIWCNDNGTQVMRLTYTPLVPCWWDVSATIGLIAKTDAAYQYRYGYLMLTPVDADGFGVAYQYEMQHSQVQTWTFCQLQHTFRLNAGIEYKVEALYYAPSGTWDLYQGPGQLHMEGRVFSR